MLNWGIIGAGKIARVFANGLRFSQTGRLVAIASRTAGRADVLADLFDIRKRYTSYEDLLVDDQVDVVYVSTIHPAHLETVVMAAKHGKHVLVEKPMAMSMTELHAMLEAARRNDIFLMEAFMYRCHPQIARILELIQSGAIGDVRMIRSEFGYDAPYDESSRVYNKGLGGGGIMDVGCYPVSMVRLIAGAVSGQPFLNPIELKATGVVGRSGIDHYTTASLKFENEVLAEISSAVRCDLPNDTVIHGSAGMLAIPNPWLPSSPCREALGALSIDTPIPSSSLILKRRDSDPEVITIPADRDLFSYEADTVAASIKDRQATSPAPSWDDTLGNMETLERWLAEIGVSYA